MKQQRMSAAQFQALHGSPMAQPSVKPQIRLPKLTTANKTELAYAEILKREFIGARVLYEPITFRLPSGTRYTPDWIVAADERILLVVETKGAHIHSPASLRAFKEARAAFPWLKFRMAQKRAEGWTTAE